MKAICVDAGFLIGLYDKTDEFHDIASKVSFRQACGVSLVRRYLRPEVTTPTRFYPEDRAARLFLPCSIRLISSLENFSGS